MLVKMHVDCVILICFFHLKVTVLTCFYFWILTCEICLSFILSFLFFHCMFFYILSVKDKNILKWTNFTLPLLWNVIQLTMLIISKESNKVMILILKRFHQCPGLSSGMQWASIILIPIANIYKVPRSYRQTERRCLPFTSHYSVKIMLKASLKCLHEVNPKCLW